LRLSQNSFSFVIPAGDLPHIFDCFAALRAADGVWVDAEE
jgi:hypothetical protein